MVNGRKATTSAIGQFDELSKHKAKYTRLVSSADQLAFFSSFIELTRYPFTPLNATATIFYLSNVLLEAKPAFSLFFSVLSLAVIFYAALNLQLSFLFLTKAHQP